MSLQALETAKPQPKQVVKRPTPRLKAALDLMVWQNITDSDAALHVGISVIYLRLEMRQPHIRAYYRGQLEVLRERESARNIHTLIEVRDQKSNQMARVQAVRALELIDDVQQSARGAQSLPGLQIVIVQGGAAVPAPVTIEHNDT